MSYLSHLIFQVILPSFVSTLSLISLVWETLAALDVPEFSCIFDMFLPFSFCHSTSVLYSSPNEF